MWSTTGTGLSGDWWESASDLIWPQSVTTYGKMRHDPQLRAVLSAFRLPILRADWAVDGTGCRAEVTRFVADNLGLPCLGEDSQPGPARRRGVTWHRHLAQALSALVYGHAVFERRYSEPDGDGRQQLDSLGPRMPWTLAEIKVATDGTVTGITQTTQRDLIPAGRLVWYGHEVEGANWTGISALRPAFGAWLLKHETWRVNATSIRRFGMGVPTVTAPQGATAAQVGEAQRLASGMRAGDQSGAGMPPGFAFQLSGLTGSVPDALGFIRYLDQQMSKMALAGLIDLGQTETGSRALGETFLDLFLLALQALADDIAETATSGWPGMPGIITGLVDVNWGEDEPAPRIVCTGVGEQHEVTAAAISQLVQYGAITADPELEAFVRQVWRLPQRAEPLPVPAAPPLPPPPVPGTPAPAVPPGTVPPGGPVTAGAGPGSQILRRQLTPAEVRAGFDPEGMHQQWYSELIWLLNQWQPVYAGQRDQLASQVLDLVDKGKLERLAALSVDTSVGAALLKASMERLARLGVLDMIREAQGQGVRIGERKVRLNVPVLGKVASARAGVAGNYLAAQAGRKALQVAPALSGAQAADQVAGVLDGLSAVSLREQLGAALTAAQNQGRLAVLDAGPEAKYIASEILDVNTCQPCADIDGEVFGSLDEAQGAYPAGIYIECLGQERCRGTIVADWAGD